MKNVEKLIRSSIIKSIASAVLAIIGIVLAVGSSGNLKKVGIVLAIIFGLGLIINNIIWVIASIHKD